MTHDNARYIILVHEIECAIDQYREIADKKLPPHLDESAEGFHYGRCDHAYDTVIDLEAILKKVSSKAK